MHESFQIDSFLHIFSLISRDIFLLFFHLFKYIAACLLSIVCRVKSKREKNARVEELSEYQLNAAEITSLRMNMNAANLIGFLFTQYCFLPFYAYIYDYISF